MKRNVKRVLSVFLAAVLLVTLFAAPATTASAVMTTGSNWVTKLDNPDVNGDGIIKILAISHSFGIDAREFITMAYDQIGDKPLMFASTYYGNCSEKQYIDFIQNNKDSAELDVRYSANYPESEKLSYSTGDGMARDTMQNYLQATDDWDIIVVNTTAAGMAADASTLKTYHDLIESNLAENSAKHIYAWYMTWSYATDCTYPSDLIRYDNDNVKMYNAIVGSVNYSVLGSGLFDLIIPTGTAIQNFRTTNVKNRTNDEYTGVNKDLCRDGFHLEFSAARWAASLSWLAALGFDVSNAKFDEANARKIGDTEIKVNEAQNYCAIESVKNAIASPKTITTSAWADRPYEKSCTNGGAHKYGSATTVAKTCTTEGYTSKTCSVCDYTYKYDYVEASHELVSVVTAPTCTAGGYTTQSCKDCTYSVQTDRKYALGHKYVDTTVAKTCTTNGSATHKCSVCGYTYTDVIPASHEVKTWKTTVEPTYAAEGERQGVCTVCGKTVTEKIDKLTTDIVYDWDYNNKEDYDDTESKTTKIMGDAHSRLYTYAEPTDSEHGAYRIYAAVDSYAYNTVNNLNQPFAGDNSLRAALITTPDSYYGKELVMYAALGKPLSYEGEDKACEMPGVIFAKDESGIYTYQVNVGKGGTLDYAIMYVPYTRTVTRMIRIINITMPYKVVAVDGKTTTATRNINDLNTRGLTQGVSITTDQNNYPYLNLEYHVSYDNATGESTMRADIIYDHDGIKWTATGESFTYKVTDMLGQFPKNNDLTKYTHNEPESAFGVANYEYVPCAKTIFANEERGYNTADVYSIKATYAEAKECDHNYTSVVVPATCTTEGYTEYTCTICGKKYTDNVKAALGHNYIETTTAATCTTAGKVVTTCSRCDYKNETVIPAAGHKYTNVTVTKPATCTEAGEKTGTCSVCGQTVTETIPATGHTWGEWVVVTPATKTSTGLKKRTCSTCSKEETETIPMLNNDIVYDWDFTDTTTGESSLAELKDNSVCTPKSASGSISYSTDGYAVISRTNERAIFVIDTPSGYTPSKFSMLTPNNCNGGGYTNVSGIGGAVIGYLTYTDDSTSVIAAGMYADKAPNAKAKVSLMAGGNYGDQYYRDTLLLSDGNGNYVNTLEASAIGIDVPADRLNYITYAIELTVNGSVVTVGGTVNYTDEEGVEHSADIKPVELSVDNLTNSKSTKEKESFTPAFGIAGLWSIGNTSHTDYFSKFYGVTARYAQNGGSTTCEHKNTKTIAAVAATCTTAGKTEEVVCADCGAHISGGETTNALGHDYKTVTVESTCTVKGSTTTTCTRCDYKDVKELPLKDHTAAAERKGVKAATCTAEGYTGDVVCKDCGTVIEAGKTTDKLGHDYKTVTVESTCTVKGSTTTTCTRCDYKDVKELPLKDHTAAAERKGVKAATCTAEGYTGDVVCKDCGTVIEAGKTIAKADHTPSDWIIDTPATSTSDGSKHTECTVCGTVLETEVIPATGRAYGDVNGDGVVDASDAVAILRYDALLETLTGDSFTAADVNGDGEVDAIDAVLILQYDSRLITAFPVDKK